VVQSGIRAIADKVELGAVLLNAKVLGIPRLIRYLRNPNPRLTVKLLRIFGATIGGGTTFKRGVYLDNVYEDQDSAGDFSRLQIGANCYIGDGVYFDLANQVVLEDNAVVSGRAAFVTHADCNRSAYLEKIYPRRCQPIRVGSGAWIGFGATLLAGVRVGHEAVVAAHALVRADVQARTLCGGVPAKTIHALENDAMRPAKP
jgi:acetyltransferase-like isoleucine patch superfamily enzyme